MTAIQKSYTEILNSISGKSWKKDESGKIGSAGIAIVVSVLKDGIIKVNHLKSRLPDFTQTELRVALKNILKSEYLVADPLNDLMVTGKNNRRLKEDEKTYRLSLAKDEKLEDGIFWALMAAVAQGWIERK